jgi:hypothetical protein
VAGWSGRAATQFYSVWWKRSTLPQVVGWPGREFFCTTSGRRSSCSKVGRPPAKRVVDHAVVGQRGRRVTVRLSGLPENMEHDRADDPAVGGDVRGVPEVVVEPAEVSTSAPGRPTGTVSR